MKKADPPIKFLSFHSYIRKLTGGVDRCVPITLFYLYRKKPKYKYLQNNNYIHIAKT